MAGTAYPTPRSQRIGVAAGIFLLALYIFTAQKILVEELMDESVANAVDQAVFFKELIEAHPEILRTSGLIDVARRHSLRLTHLAADGQVLQDSNTSFTQSAQSETRANRLEFVRAQTQQYGTAVRYSETLHLQMIYVAIRLHDNTFLRLGLPYEGMKGSLENNIILLLILVVLITGVIALLYHVYSRQMQQDLRRITRGVQAVAEGNYAHNVALPRRKEFEPLAKAVAVLARDIQASMQTITDKNCQLETILESLQEGVLVLDYKGCIISYNKSFGEIFPLVHDCLGQTVNDAVPLPALQVAVQKVLQAKLLKVKTIRMEGEGKKQYLVHICPALQQISHLGIIVIVHDITNILYLEQVHKDFVSNVSHELRTPLTAIKGYAETLVNARCTLEDSRNFGFKILRNGSYLANIIENLLALARVDDEDKLIEKEVINLLTCIKMAKLQVLVPDSCSIEVVADKPAGLCGVYANAVLLSQAIRNLLENALRYAPSGSVVRIGCRCNAGGMEISVSDQGKGIPPEEQNRIFERFYRVEKHRDSQTTGLGLAITKQIIERFDGNLWVESPSPIANTTFYITLPCVKAGDSNCPVGC